MRAKALRFIVGGDLAGVISAFLDARANALQLREKKSRLYYDLHATSRAYEAAAVEFTKQSEALQDATRLL